MIAKSATLQGARVLVTALGFLLFAAVQPSLADVSSDRATAILIFPKIAADDGALTVDTILQISNTSLEPQVLHCFYINATGHCSATSAACDPVTRPCGIDGGFCEPGWVETDFFIYITPRQPLAWRASVGLANGLVPLDGDFRTGPEGDSNEGTRVPPIGEVPYAGELKCIVIDEDGRPIARNVVKGEATITTTDGVNVDVAKYNAVGLEAIEGDSDENRVLVLGSNEYAGCPQTLIVDHLFDFALNPVNGLAFSSNLVLVPCTQDLLLQIPGSTTAQYLIFNEFEQRFSTSQPVDCYFDRPISRIDTTQPERSIFSAFVSGTIAGQTRVRGVQQGLLGILVLHEGDRSAASNLHTQGDRELPDFITLP